MFSDNSIFNETRKKQKIVKVKIATLIMKEKRKLKRIQ